MLSRLVSTRSQKSKGAVPEIAIRSLFLVLTSSFPLITDFRKARSTEWKKEEAKAKVALASKSWDPAHDQKVEGDPFRTLFVSRLSYDVNEKRLKKEFEEFGPIRNIKIVRNSTGKSRGYAFIEFDHKTDMKNAYKQADGRKIEGRRVVVDVERGRTVENWKPRRLGGGLGGQGREAKLSKKQLMAGGILPSMDR